MYIFDEVFDDILENIKNKNKDLLIKNIEKLNEIDDINEFNEIRVMDYLEESDNFEMDEIFIENYDYIPRREFYEKLNIIKNPSTDYEQLVECLESGPESNFINDIYLYHKILFERFVELKKENEIRISIEKMQVNKK